MTTARKPLITIRSNREVEATFVNFDMATEELRTRYGQPNRARLENASLTRVPRSTCATLGGALRVLSTHQPPSDTIFMPRECTVRFGKRLVYGNRDARCATYGCPTMPTPRRASKNSGLPVQAAEMTNPRLDSTHRQASRHAATNTSGRSSPASSMTISAGRPARLAASLMASALSAS